MLRAISFLTEGENNRAQECPSDAQRARDDAGPPAGGAASAGRRPGHGRLIDDREEVAATLPGGRAGGTANPLQSPALQPASAAPWASPAHHCPAPAAAHRTADCAAIARLGS